MSFPNGELLSCYVYLTLYGSHYEMRFERTKCKERSKNRSINLIISSFYLNGLSAKSSVLFYFFKSCMFYSCYCHVITVSQQIDILELKDLEREYVLARSRLTLAQQDPSSAAIAGNCMMVYMQQTL